MTLAQFLGSSVLAAVISGIVAYVVAGRTAQATVKAANIAADAQREQLEHQKKLFSIGRQDLARDDFIRAVDVMGQVRLQEARLDVRQRRGREAVDALRKVYLILGPSPDEPVQTLLTALQAGTEADLDKAAALWPEVERVLMELLHPSSEVPPT